MHIDRYIHTYHTLHVVAALFDQTQVRACYERPGGARKAWCLNSVHPKVSCVSAEVFFECMLTDISFIIILIQ